MTADSDHPPGKAAKDRDQRLASALRANLQRRKAQARARNEAGGPQPQPGEPDAPHDSAGIVPEKPAR